MRTAYREAIDRSAGPEFKWPRRSQGNRLEPEAWPIVRPKFLLRPGETIFSIGSCFARNMEDYLEVLGFSLPTRAFRVPDEEALHIGGNQILNKYTPAAIHHDIEWAAKIFDRGGAVNDADIEPLLFDLDGGYCIDMHLAGFYAVQRERAYERRRELAALFQKIFDSDVLLLTFGLIEAWYDCTREIHIQQTPTTQMVKATPNRFEFDFLSFERTLDYARRSIQIALERGRAKRIIVTTSPIPIVRTFSGEDVLVANTHAKSVLRAVCGCLSEEFNTVDYFPSYETVMHSKRAEFWEDDLIHVKAECVAKVARRVAQVYIEPAQSDTRRALQLQQQIGQFVALRDSYIPLRGARCVAGKAHLVDAVNSFSISAGEPGGDASRIEWGPLDLTDAVGFQTNVSCPDTASPDVKIDFEVRDAEGKAMYRTSAIVRRGAGLRWRLRLAPLSPVSIISLTACAVPGTGNWRAARLRFSYPQFATPRSPQELYE
jgi:hypothetical protein